MEKTFSRLEGSIDQASTFLLAQAMGGGKTHNMIALGLLAQDPELRRKILGKNSPGATIGNVSVWCRVLNCEYYSRRDTIF